MEFNIRKGGVDDWREIDRINRAVLPENYDETLYRQLLSSPTTICFVATKSVKNIETTEDCEDLDDELDEGFETKNTNELVGYIIIVIQFDNLKRLSSHIFSIGISQEFRRNGIGSQLLDKSIRVLKGKFQIIRSITLHVRKSNKIAYQFYCKKGFSRVKVAKKYYQNENAYLMKRSIY